MTEQETQAILSNVEAVENSEQGSGSYQPGFATPETPDVKSNFEKLLPETYKEKFFVKNALKAENPFEHILQGYDNLEKTLGQRGQLQLPTAETPPEQRKAFYTQLGVPETPDAYKIEPQQWEEQDKQLGEFLTKAHDAPFMNGMKQIFHEANLTPEQVNKVVNGYDKLFMSQFRSDVTAMAEAAAQNDNDFSQMAQTLYGDSAGQIMDVGNKMLKQFVPDNIRPLIPQLDNKSLMVLSGVLNTIHKQFMSEDNLSIPVTGTAKTRAELIAEGERLMLTDEFKNTRHINHEAMTERVNAIFRNLPPK